MGRSMLHRDALLELSLFRRWAVGWRVLVADEDGYVIANRAAPRPYAWCLRARRQITKSAVLKLVPELDMRAAFWRAGWRRSCETASGVDPVELFRVVIPRRVIRADQWTSGRRNDQHRALRSSHYPQRPPFYGSYREQ